MKSIFDMDLVEIQDVLDLNEDEKNTFLGLYEHYIRRPFENSDDVIKRIFVYLTKNTSITRIIVLKKIIEHEFMFLSNMCSICDKNNVCCESPYPEKFYIQCLDCKTRGPETVTEDEAYRAWNKLHVNL